MNVYISEGEIYCEDCGKRIQKEENIEINFIENYDNQEADFVQHCGEHSNCINAIEVNGEKYGCWLENELTEYGVGLLWSDIIDNSGGVMIPLWKEWYAEQLADYRTSIQMLREYLRDADKDLEVIARVGEKKLSIHLVGHDPNKKRLNLVSFYDDTPDADYTPYKVRILLQLIEWATTGVERHPVIGVFGKDREEHRLLVVEVFDDRVELIFDEEEL